MKKGYKKDMAIDVLKSLCIAGQLVRCDKCCFVEPNDGHGTPYCMLFTIINRQCEPGTAITYTLEDGTIPKECKYWTSLKYTKERRESIERIRQAQNAINKLKQIEKKQLRL